MGRTFGEIPVDMAKSIFFEVNFLGLNFYENNSKLIDLLWICGVGIPQGWPKTYTAYSEIKSLVRGAWGVLFLGWN